MVKLVYKLMVLYLYFVSSLVMLVVNGRLATVSIYRLFKDYNVGILDLFKDDYKKEDDIYYVSDRLKDDIIRRFIYENSSLINSKRLSSVDLINLIKNKKY